MMFVNCSTKHIEATVRSTWTVHDGHEPLQSADKESPTSLAPQIKSHLKKGYERTTASLETMYDSHNYLDTATLISL